MATTFRNPRATYDDDTNRREFATTKNGTRQCHQRDANGVPNCGNAIVAKRANLCPAHERVWQKAARVRYAARRAASTSA